MQVPISILACITTIASDGDIIKMPVLWEDDRHYQHYRCLVMQTAIDKLESIIESLDTPYNCELLDQLTLLKINIGNPTRMSRQIHQ